MGKVIDIFWKASDGVQNTLPQNMVPWHTEYFELKEFKKTQMQESPSDLPQPSSPESGLKALMGEVPSLYPEERNILISKTGMPRRIQTSRPF